MPSPWPQSPPTPAHRAAYADAAPRPFWLDTLPSREPHPSLTEQVSAELCIVGGGFTGLWAALYAKEQTPTREVVVLEASLCGDGASGRNGGFLQSSLTHGTGNGLSRFPDELVKLERLGLENFRALAHDLERLGIDAEYEATGDLVVALASHELEELDEAAELARRFGHQAEVLDRDRVRAQLDSSLFLGGLQTHTGSALVHPGKLADGLRVAAARAGVQIYEGSAVTELGRTDAGVSVRTGAGAVHAARVLLATSAYPPLLPAIRRYIAPVYDYALMSEPLSEQQRDAIGWHARQGVGDMGNQFHYYRLSADDRILWGGYDAVYRYGGPVSSRYDGHDPTFAKLSQHFFTTFPQLEGLRFTHRWGGAIDTCSRFSVFFGSALGGRVVYALGYTGLGVGASRFGARIGLDLLDGRANRGQRVGHGPPPPGSIPTGATAQRRHSADAQPPGRRRP